MNKVPFLSIVIANYNYGHVLGTAIESILNQDCTDYEIIIVDGASTDNSVDIIKKYQDKIAWWVSEPDKGQSDAFNKGFSHAKGEFLTWLNADDILLPGTIKAVKDKIEKTGAEWATGNFLRFNNQDKKIIEVAWGPHVLPKWLQGPQRTVRSFGPTTFWSRRVYEKVGPIDENLHYTMDSDYWIRMNNHGVCQVRVNHYCWGFRMHQDSKTAYMTSKEELQRLEQERKYSAVKHNYHPSIFWNYVSLLMRLLDGSFLCYLFNRRLLGKPIEKAFNINYVI